MECNHCWHYTGKMLTSNPPQRELICCHCGEIKTEYIGTFRAENIDDHGKYHPESSWLFPWCIVGLGIGLRLSLVPKYQRKGWMNPKLMPETINRDFDILKMCSVIDQEWQSLSQSDNPTKTLALGSLILLSVQGFFIWYSMKWKTENLTGINLILTTHAKKRIGERYTGSQPIIDVLQESKSAHSTVLKYLQKECPGHKTEMRKKEYLYWYNKKKSKKIWRVFVTKPELFNKWVVVTYFETSYNNFYP